MTEDILTPDARRVLDALGNSGQIIEWDPARSADRSFVVTWPDETESRITVEATS